MINYLIFYGFLKLIEIIKIIDMPNSFVFNYEDICYVLMNMISFFFSPFDINLSIVALGLI